jgi:hypothetical protein
MRFAPLILAKPQDTHLPYNTRSRIEAIMRNFFILCFAMQTYIENLLYLFRIAFSKMEEPDNARVLIQNRDMIQSPRARGGLLHRLVDPVEGVGLCLKLLYIEHTRPYQPYNFRNVTLCEPR